MRSAYLRIHAALPIVAILLGGMSVRLLSQTRSRNESVAGRVHALDTPVGAAHVYVTMAPSLRSDSTLSDSLGRFEVRVVAGTGDYLVYVTAAGYKPFRKRILLAADSVINLDVALEPALQQLAAVRVVESKPTPIPDGGFGNDPAAVDARPSALFGAVSPESAGNLAAVAGTVPGITVATAGGLVAFGLPGQVSTTLNGMSTPGVEIPSDVMARVRVLTSAYDPSIGGFGGGRISVEMAQGGRIREAQARVGVDGPWLQFGGTPVSQLGSRPKRAQLDLNADGPLADHDTWYNAGLTLKHLETNVHSLLDGPTTIGQLGISSDSVEGALQAASAFGLLADGSSAARASSSTGLALLARVDHFRDPVRYRKPWSNSFSGTVFVNLNHTGTSGITPFAAPTLAFSNQSAIGQLIGQWLHMTNDYSTELTSSASVSRSSSTPSTRLPQAEVVIRSSLPSIGTVARNIELGGRSAPYSTNENVGWETVGALNLYLGRSHKIRIYARSALTKTTTSSGEQSGTFLFQSLGDFAADRPQEFARTLVSPAGAAGLWSGAFAVGDVWQITPVLQLEPGLRLDDSRSLLTPRIEPFVQTLTDNAGVGRIARIDASPRLGFAWTPRRAVPVQVGTATTGVIWLPSPGVLSGGIGMFRHDPTSSLIIPIAESNDRANQLSRIVCVGDAVPHPDWAAYLSDPSSIPQTCAGGSASPFAQDAPNITVLDKSYMPARSWRANLRYASAFGSTSYSADAAWSRNVRQPGVIDANFSGITRFKLADESERPVFVPADAIVSSSGEIAPTAGRRSPSWGQVTDIVSDLQSTARQLTLMAAPAVYRGVLRLSYTFSDVTDVERGFDGTTFGSPLERQAGPSPYQVRHRFTIDVGRALGLVGISGRWDVFSGERYTPLVSSDINGDGLANDRAFIFNPATVADQRLASEMRALLDRHSAATSCLVRQLGSAAARNSCSGPWTSTVTAAVATKTLHIMDGRAMTGQIAFSNLLGGIDQLVHGVAHTHGWGISGSPDPYLLFVRGFDPTTRRYNYAVNPEFGSARSALASIVAPFRITLSARVELGRPVRQKQFDKFLQMAADRGDTQPAPIDSLISRLSYQTPDYYAYLVRLRDSLLLTPDQVDSLQTADRAYRQQADAVWRSLAQYIIGRRGQYDVNDIAHRVDESVIAVLSIQRNELPRMRRPLTSGQLALADQLLEPLARSATVPLPRPVLF